MTAQPITCDLCQAELASLLVSNLGNGETMGVGSACMYAWASSMAATFDPANVPGETDPATTDEPGDGGESGAAKPRRPRGKATRPTVVPDRADDPGETAATPDATAD